MATAEYLELYTKELSNVVCETCGLSNEGGAARAVSVTEDGEDTSWVLWLLPNGWSESDFGELGSCPEHQTLQSVLALVSLDAASHAAGLRGITQEEYEA